MQPEVVALLVAAAAVIGAALGALVVWRRSPVPPPEVSGPVVRDEPATSVGRGGDPGWSADVGGVLETLEVGLVRLDSELNVVRVNRAASRMLHLDARPEARRSVMQVFLDHRVEESAQTALQVGSAALELTLRNGEERRVACRFRRADGGGIWIVLDDVTELRRLQRIRSEFIDNLSHELRTPLTTIRLLTETLSLDLEHVDVAPRIRERVSKIDVETGHLVQMVNELLDLSRIEGGAAELHFASVDMTAVITAALERLRAFADRQRIGLEADLPETSLPRVWGDEERLGQVLVNLLHNAVKFSPESTTVTVAAHESDGQLAVSVRDQGVGIPRADLDRVFERFYKTDKARSRGWGGTGLGLSIARHIVEGHGGRIWVESEEGRGSEFTFTVPLAAG